MSELGDTFKAFKDFKDEKKLLNVKASTRILENMNIFFICCNEATRHYLVQTDIDFWPSTGVWIQRKSNKRGRGIYRLLNFIHANYKPIKPLLEEPSDE